MPSVPTLPMLLLSKGGLDSLLAHLRSLYVEDIDVGEEAPRVVVSGLVKYKSTGEMLGARVVVVANMKPTALRGVRSHAMLLCASSSDGSKVRPCKLLKWLRSFAAADVPSSFCNIFPLWQVHCSIHRIGPWMHESWLASEGSLLPAATQLHAHLNTDPDHTTAFMEFKFHQLAEPWLASEGSGLDGQGPAQDHLPRRIITRTCRLSHQCSVSQLMGW